MMTRPLEGLKVLDLSRVVAAPLATMLLGDLGAEVIKVERPGAGDETRSWGPPFAAGESAYYLALNRHKASVAVDLGRAEGRALVERLIADWADVVVENFRDGSLERLGLDAHALRVAHPHLIWAELRGYPPGDPRPGYDFIIQGLSGFMALNGDPDGPPTRAPVAVSDIVTGLYLANGILAALVRRRTSGQGGTVTVSLYEAQLASLPNVTESYLVTGEEPRRHGNAHPQLAPYEVVEAADGPFALGVGNDRQFHAALKVLDLPALAADPRFRDNQSRVRHRTVLLAELAPRLRQRTRGEWIERLTLVGVPAGPIRTVGEALSAQETVAAGLVASVEHPRIGTLRMVANPLWIDGERLPVRTPPPLLGEHTAVVLERLGYGPDAIRTLVETGVVALSDSRETSWQRPKG